MEEDIKRDIVNYRRQKACDLMHDVDVLIDNELWNSAVNRMYYACFHMVSALLILHGIEVKSHMGVREQLEVIKKENIVTAILKNKTIFAVV